MQYSIIELGQKIMRVVWKNSVNHINLTYLQYIKICNISQLISLLPGTNIE